MGNICSTCTSIFSGCIKTFSTFISKNAPDSKKQIGTNISGYRVEKKDKIYVFFEDIEPGEYFEI